MEQETYVDELVRIDGLKIEKVLVRDMRFNENVVKVQPLIALYITKGTGTKENPVRQVVNYWDMQGNYLGEIKESDINPLIT